MADNLGLDYDEIVILKETSVAHGGVMAMYTDELVLTNKKIICISKGMFGGTKKIYHYPLDQIKVFNGMPQVRQGKYSNGTATLDVYMVDGEDQFSFQTKNKKTISTWIYEINKLFGIETVQGGSENGADDDTVLGAFKEVGEEFKDVGREIAEQFGFKLKKKNTVGVNNNGNTSAANGINTGLKCSACGNPITAGAKFCPSCGAAIGLKKPAEVTPQEIICPNCGKKLDPSLRFCTECGTELVASTTTEKSADTTNISVDVPPKGTLAVDQQIELLQKLKSLVDAGVISQEEFEAKKKEIL
ncbi:zinc ribbon domain-containing protein [Butyrivibrio sp. AE3004]|uniref:zinc ribbon domain-containing protein n=1 Tax=Butyrivibrio sp. AE3004 TaxID=1506994 RepID=UPI00068FA845|nr:zinc-ribbon domain-containing protein [Butyrivibrio sp. AE3004]